jgi:hypothetical protein
LSPDDRIHTFHRLKSMEIPLDAWVESGDHLFMAQTPLHFNAH